MFAPTVLAALTLAGAAPVPQDAKAKRLAAEWELLAGMWEIESATLGGQAYPIGNPPARYEFKVGSVTVAPTGAVWKLYIDPVADPKRMTQTEAERKDGKLVPVEGGQVRRAVYAVDKDKLTVAIWRGPKPEFPPSVTPDPDAPVMMIVYKRVKN